ncbi:MAG TPA: lipopolysaccharide biosynthesis protein [Sphingomonas sp.]|jgi:O-antigen/teichoic acid export membrane protein|uniref:lipopolysaccharide biosynthesis protein n=1 Tax=Sphingomonas sp. TaxID=28214 RepID=UPI002ED7CC91
MTADAATNLLTPAEGPIRRALRNAAWLLGGKGVGGLFSLVYLALVARTLGVAGFGVFAVILAYGQALANVVGFQSWQTVIRYGARHHADARPELFAQVLGFATLLDLGAALVGGVIAVAGALLIGPMIGWSPETQSLAAWFGVSLLFGQRGAPTGVLRLFDRFDLAAYAELTLPATRLIGTLLAWVLDGGLAGYLLAWALAELVTTVSMWVQAWRELKPRAMAQGRWRLQGLTIDNPGIWRFSITTNLTASIGLVWQQIPILAVGWIAGPAGAGGYRMATQLGTALTKPVVSLARSIYPEFARLSVGSGAAALGPVMQRTALMSAAAGALSVVLIWFAGTEILLFVGGPAYLFAYPVLVVLTLSSALNLVGFGLEPALTALGRPGAALVARGVATLFYLMLLALLLPRLGPIGAAWATLAATGASLLLLWCAYRRVP